MQRLLMAVLILWVPVAPAHPRQARKSADAASRITEVAVYPDRARVTRTASLDVDVGTSDVVIKDLPATLIENSIRAKAVGGAAKVVGIETKRVFAEKPRNEDIARLTDQIQKLNDEMGTHEDALRIMQNTETFLTSLRSQYSDKVSKEMLGSKLDMEGITKLVELTEKQSSDQAVKRRGIQGRQRELNEKLAVLQQELQQIHRQRNTESKTVTVTLDLPQKNKVDVQVSYVLHGASWRPIYDARTSGPRKQVELIYYGVVIQNTGEDWNDIELVLSTAQPALSGQPPELAARFVDFSEQFLGKGQMAEPQDQARRLKEYEKKGESRSRAGKDADASGYAPAGGSGGAGPAAAPPAFETAQAEEKTTAVFFKVKKRETIPSNNQPHKTTLSVDTFDARFEYEAVPSLSPHGYLKSSMRNKDNPLLAGELNIFMDEDFIGTSLLKAIAPTQPFHAWLGVDEGVRAIRKETGREEGTRGGFLSSTRQRQSFKYAIKAANFKKQPIKLSITEPAPLTRQEEIEVSIPNATPGYTRTEEGYIQWAIELQPNEERELSYEIEVLYPRDKQISIGTLMPQQFRQEYERLQELNKQQLRQK